MLAHINFSRNIRRILLYNEQKVQLGKATCIYAGNYLQLPEEMNFQEKLDRFKKLINLNDRTEINTAHISLNFHPSDRLDRERLVAIASDYMNKMGFAGQPVLIYQHMDAGHPHIHLISTIIQEDGKRISSCSNYTKSLLVTREIDLAYGLMKGADRPLTPELVQAPGYVQKVQYGKTEITRSLARVLDSVIDKYKYTTLNELNAVLRQYNVMADRGREGSVLYQKRGLLYRVLDENGRTTGRPISASIMYSKPTLEKLEMKFAENEYNRQADRKKLCTSIDWIMARKPADLTDFEKSMESEHVHVFMQRDRKGNLQGIFFTDHRTKAVFSGEALGKAYSAEAILERLEAGRSREKDRTLEHRLSANRERPGMDERSM